MMLIKNLNKRGVIFTALTIILLSFFLLSYSIYSITQDRTPIRNRIETLNSFVFSIEEDLPRELYISGFRIIFSFGKKIIETGEFITDINSTFKETFYNGTIDGIDEELMNGVKFSDIVDSLNERASKINANVSLMNTNINIMQEDPWRVKIVLSTDLLVQDNSNLVLWNKSMVINSYISIENFEDPIYVVKTNGLVPNKINKTIYSSFVDGSDVSNLMGHLENSYYIASTEAPSFLDRLEGKLSSNENGIESLVYLPELIAQGISIKDKSVVDHVYFSNNIPPSNQIQGMPSWFKIDEDHLNDYEVEGLTV